MSHLAQNLTVRFLAASCVAGMLVALCVLAPRWERNRVLESVCRQEQFQLIELERTNRLRADLLEQLRGDASLIGQVAEYGEMLEVPSAELIMIPDSLAIHPDELLHSGSSQSVQSVFAAGQPSGESVSVLNQVVSRVAGEPSLRSGIAWTAVGVLVLGLLPGERRFYRWVNLLGMRRLHRFVSRYRVGRPPSGRP